MTLLTAALHCDRAIVNEFQGWRSTDKAACDELVSFEKPAVAIDAYLDWQAPLLGEHGLPHHIELSYYLHPDDDVPAFGWRMGLRQWEILQARINMYFMCIERFDGEFEEAAMQRRQSKKEVPDADST